jgi:hypothetical protein
VPYKGSATSSVCSPFSGPCRSPCTGPSGIHAGSGSGHCFRCVPPPVQWQWHMAEIEEEWRLLCRRITRAWRARWTAFCLGPQWHRQCQRPEARGLRHGATDSTWCRGAPGARSRGRQTRLSQLVPGGAGGHWWLVAGGCCSWLLVVVALVVPRGATRLLSTHGAGASALPASGFRWCPVVCGPPPPAPRGVLCVGGIGAWCRLPGCGAGSGSRGAGCGCGVPVRRVHTCTVVVVVHAGRSTRSTQDAARARARAPAPVPVPRATAQCHCATCATCHIHTTPHTALAPCACAGPGSPGAACSYFYGKRQFIRAARIDTEKLALGACSPRARPPPLLSLQAEPL